MAPAIGGGVKIGIVAGASGPPDSVQAASANSRAAETEAAAVSFKEWPPWRWGYGLWIVMSA